MNMLQINYAGRSDTGLRRSNNEDSLVVEPGLGILVVADGMGGAASGEVASRIFADTAREVFSGSAPGIDEITSASVQKAFAQANDSIFVMASQNQEHRGMGCTAELLAFYGENYIIGHVGDSRTYLSRRGN